MKKVWIVIVLGGMLFGTATAQNCSQMSPIVVPYRPGVYPVDEKNVCDVVEEMPSFPGGPKALLNFIDSVKVYPAEAKMNGIQGRVILSFVVEKDGSLTNIKVVKSVDPALDKEAVRVVKKMPRWNPGKQNGVCVKVKFVLPVTFRLK